jgi:hypothetical protein
MTPAQKEQLEALARHWKDPKTGQSEPDLNKALSGLVCDYFGFESRDGEDLDWVISDKITYWAKRVCLFPSDIYDKDLEEDLVRKLADEDLKLTGQFNESFHIEPAPELEHCMQERFRDALEEECACTNHSLDCSMTT